MARADSVADTMGRLESRPAWESAKIARDRAALAQTAAELARVAEELRRASAEGAPPPEGEDAGPAAPES